MRHLRFFVVFITAILFCLESQAFTASYEQTTSGTGEKIPQKITFKIKDDKIRMEMDTSQGTRITIIDGKVLYSYDPSKNSALKLVNKNPRGMNVLSDYGAYLESLDARLVGSEKIDKYDCDIYEFTDPRLNMLSKTWLWKEKGFPVKVETKTPGGIMTTLMKNVKIGLEIDDSEFMLPPGVEIIDMQKAMKR